MMRAFLTVVSLGALIAPAPASASVPGDRAQAAILARVFAYDRNLVERAGTSVTVAVLVGPEGRSKALEEILAGLNGISKLTVRGLPLSVIELNYRGAGSLEAEVLRLGVDVLYLGPGLEAEIARIIEITRRRQILTAAAAPEYLPLGASLGIFLEDGKPRIHVNLEASRSEGAAFLPDLLRLAKIVR